MKRIICFGITFIILLAVWPHMTAGATEPLVLDYIAFGDSIAKGYSCSDDIIEPYPVLVKKEIGRRTGAEVKLLNTAKNGLNTTRLMNGSLSEESVLAQTAGADIITVTIGANDLIDEFKKVIQDILGRPERFHSLEETLTMLNDEMGKHPMLVLKAIGALAGWDYGSFENNYCQMMDNLTRHAGGQAQIVVTNLYNPASKMGLPGALNKVVEGVIGKMNEIIDAHQEEYGYKVADLSGSDICDYVQEDGLHPTQEGQELIAAAVLDKIELYVSDNKEDPGNIPEEENGGADGKMTVYASCISLIITGAILIALGIWDKDQTHDKDREKENGKDQ